jgi:hypothetical protein
LIGIPFLSDFFVGYDIFKGFPDSGVDTGFTNSPFNFTYNKFKTTDDLRYYTPDQIETQ